MSTLTLSRPSTPADTRRPELRQRALALVSATRLHSLIVIDAPEISDDALTEIADVAGLSRGGVTLLRSIEPLAWIQALDDPLTEYALQVAARRYLREVAEQLGAGGMQVSTKVSMGLPLEQAVEETSRDCAAGIIVLVR
jgi:nucleotide-binding universal stress UspA family protein